MSDSLKTFGEILKHIETESPTAWVYLPAGGEWTLQSQCAVLESEEVPPECEDEPDAGVPEFAKDHSLQQALPVATLQDIIRNLRSQKQNATLEELLKAFYCYYRNDAFVDLNGGGSATEGAKGTPQDVTHR